MQGGDLLFASRLPVFRNFQVVRVFGDVHGPRVLKFCEVCLLPIFSACREFNDQVVSVRIFSNTSHFTS